MVQERHFPIRVEGDVESISPELVILTDKGEVRQQLSSPLTLGPETAEGSRHFKGYFHGELRVQGHLKGKGPDGVLYASYLVQLAFGLLEKTPMSTGGNPKDVAISAS